MKNEPASSAYAEGQELLRQARREVGEAWRLLMEMRLALAKSAR